MRSKGVTFPLAASVALGHGAQTATPLYKNPITIPGVGKVQGIAALNSSASSYISNYESISFFGGIPFGADTSGSNRWAAPKPAPTWNGILNTTSFGPICAQSNSQLASAYEMSEDCLTINIWTPATSSDDLLPVAIWSYGAGTAPPQADNGAGVAAKGIIFVSYNYRSGIFGFMASPELTEAGSTNSSGNWGILDQFAAVKWVHENIAAFGGNPDHISVIGQSFGSGATYHIVNSEMTADLGIVNAICESGVTYPYDPYTTQQANAYINQTAAETVGTTALSTLNVTTIAEARALSADDIISATASLTMSFLPVLDYFSIPDTYINTLTKGAGNKVPYLTGFNADESGASSTLVSSTTQFEAFVGGFYGDFATEILALYPDANDTQAAVSQSNLVRESFRTSSWLFMNAFANSSDVDTYTYYWNHGAPGGDGASHGSEIVYVLGNLWAQTGVNYTSEDYAISDVVSAYWANFMKTSNPNTGGSYINKTLPGVWDVASPEAKEVFQIGSDFKMIPVASDAKIEVLTEFFEAQTPF